MLSDTGGSGHKIFLQETKPLEGSDNKCVQNDEVVSIEHRDIRKVRLGEQPR